MPKFATATFLTKQHFILNLHLDPLFFYYSYSSKVPKDPAPQHWLALLQNPSKVTGTVPIGSFFFPPIMKVNRRRTSKQCSGQRNSKNV